MEFKFDFPNPRLVRQLESPEAYFFKSDYFTKEDQIRWLKEMQFILINIREWNYLCLARLWTSIEANQINKSSAYRSLIHEIKEETQWVFIHSLPLKKIPFPDGIDRLVFYFFLVLRRFLVRLAWQSEQNIRLIIEMKTLSSRVNEEIKETGVARPISRFC